MVEALASAGLDEINFAGGEPTLCPWLHDLIRLAKELGLTTSIVATDSRITPGWLDIVEASRDWATLIMDTVNPQQLRELRRTTRSGPISEEDYLGVIDILRPRGIRVKINTAVTLSNSDEGLTGVIARARTEWWIC